MNKLGFYIILFSLLFFCNGFCQDRNYFKGNSIGMEIGTWKPNYFQNKDDPFSLKITKEDLYLGFCFSTPLSSSLGLRFTFGYYNYAEDKNKSIYLLPLLLDIKYMLVTGSSISPFVSYGIGACLGHQNKSQTETVKQSKDQVGYSINFGTGFDVLLFSRWILGVEFRYHYVKFSEVYIFTDDYSGPKINFNLFYLFK